MLHQTAIGRNIPGIAFSAANPTLGYTALTNTTNPSTWAAELAVQFVNTIAKNARPGLPILPLGYGINVNFPPLNSTCMQPPLVPSRFSGGSGMPKFQFNATSKLIQISGNNYFGEISAGENQCINGECSLPGESVVVTSCKTSVSIFTLDYDAPVSRDTFSVERLVFGDDW